MFESDLLNRGPYFYLGFNRRRFLQPSVEVCPADRAS
jgi:hypothetical protein